MQMRRLAPARSEAHLIGEARELRGSPELLWHCQGSRVLPAAAAPPALDLRTFEHKAGSKRDLKDAPQTLQQDAILSSALGQEQPIDTEA